MEKIPDHAMTRPGRPLQGFQPRRAVGSEDVFSFYLASTIFLSFFTYSVHTPLGYLSFEDIAIGVALLGYLLGGIGSGRGSLPNMLVVISSLIVFSLILFSTVVMNTGLDISPVIKYTIFLIAIPATIWFSGHSTPSPELYARVLRNFGICGNLLLAYVWASILLGQHTGAGENYAISLLGQAIYKNQIGEFMVFISSANFALYVLKKNIFHLAFYLAAIVCCLSLDVRGPILAALVISGVICWFFLRLNVASLLKIVAMLAVLLVILYALYASGLMERQFDRLLNFADTSVTGSHNVSSSASRIILWKYAISLLDQSPMFGIGYGGFFYDQSRDWMYGLREPHNNVLQILSEGGWVGLLAFAALLYFGFTTRATSRGELALKLIAAAYLMTTLVDIVWVRGTGHLFFTLFYLFALHPSAKSQPQARAARQAGLRRLPAWR